MTGQMLSLKKQTIKQNTKEQKQRHTHKRIGEKKDRPALVKLPADL